jgi:hypothetical protein
MAREDDIAAAAADGGQMTPGATTIHVDHPGGLDAIGARRLAADLLAAAELAEPRSPSYVP